MRTEPADRPVTRLHLAVAAVAVAVLVACGGDSGSDTATSDTATRDSGASASTNTSPAGDTAGDSCLVTLDEVTAALPPGTNPEVVDLGFDLPDSSICGFRWEKFKQGTLQVTSYSGTGASVEAANPKRADAVDVPGLGDRAYATGGERSVSLTVFQGDSAVIVDITQFPPDQNIAPRIEEWKGDALAAAKQLATASLRRL